MKINKELIYNFKHSNSKLLAVTKYWSLEEIKNLIGQFQDTDLYILEGFGENRINSLKEKKLNRVDTHFIGNIQTKEIKHIVEYCSTIHSVSNIKHIRKIQDICIKKGTWVKIFIQINLDSNKESGIRPEQIPEFLSLIDECENIGLVGFSGIGKGEFSIDEKIKEFELLKTLRSKYIPNGLISAGTSIDYKIALIQEIDIVRVGTLLIK